MKHRALDIVGTCHGYWTQWIGRILVQVEQAAVHQDLPVTKTLETLNRNGDDVRMLIFVEHPTTGLARWIALGEDADPESWLDDWLESARALLLYARQHPDATILVNADEVRRRPHRLSQLLRSRWGCELAVAPRIPREVGPDLLAQALARSLVERDPSLQDSVLELMASCVVMPGFRPAGAGIELDEHVDGVLVVHRLAALLRAEQHLEAIQVDRQTERDAVDRERRSMAEEQSRLWAAVKSLEAERDDLKARFGVADKDLLVARSRLESAAQERGALLKRIDDALGQQLTNAQLLTVLRESVDSLGRQMAEQLSTHSQSERHRERLEEELVQARKQRSALETALAEKMRRCDALQSELDTARESLRTASVEESLLLQQLHQVQEELEQMFLAKRDVECAVAASTEAPGQAKLEQALQTARDECELAILQSNQVQQELLRVHDEKFRLVRDLQSRIHLPGFENIAIGDIELGGMRDTPPHREVSFTVRDVRADGRRPADTQVRLVEHWGRPGMVIFAVPGATPLIDSWVESGREDDRPYLLLVHGDANSDRVFDSMGTLDWQIVQALALRMHQVIGSAQDGDVAVWASLSRRLLAALRERPARLRQEGVLVMPIAQDSPEVARWGLVLQHASFDLRVWQRLTIQWRPSEPNRSIELLRDEDCGPPLLSWPADADGLPARALRLPFFDRVDAPEMRQAWEVIAPTDKAFVEEILLRLPQLAAHIGTSESRSAIHGKSEVDLQAVARLMAQQGRIALYPPVGGTMQLSKGRRLLKRVARGLRHSDSPTGEVAAVAHTDS